MSLRGASKAGKFVHCVGNPAFNPDVFIQDVETQKKANEYLSGDDLLKATVHSFGLPAQDVYVYHAMTSVKLAEVQHIVGLGGVNGLHSWYRSEKDGTILPPPTAADIEAYVSIFSPATLTPSAMKTFLANAKKDSIRADVAGHLASKRFIHPSLSTKLAIPRAKSPPSLNPYLDFWTWSCRSLEWCGPCGASSNVATSHHVLPILMHHFGCATPSHEALEILRLVSAGRAVTDIGSGNGYWSFMLRRYGLTVHAIDNMQSEWRVNWIADTEISDGIKWLGKHTDGKDMVLLLVYPVVGGGVAGGVEGAFTRDLIDAYQGDTIAVVGTQNANGYTGFRTMTMDQYMEKEQKEWTKIVQVPLPSFAGKDEALFIFQRGERAPKDGQDGDATK